MIIAGVDLHIDDKGNLYFILVANKFKNPSKRKWFFLPVCVLSELFRNEFINEMKKLELSDNEEKYH